MDTFYQTKLKELVTEFTRYLLENPDFAEAVPEGAQVVLLGQRDPAYSRQAMEYAARARDKDDNPRRPVVYIEVTKMLPVRSRVQELHILERPPVYSV